jgi:hypothetical protein
MLQKAIDKIQLKKRNEIITVKIYPSNIQGYNYIYRLIDNKHKERQYTIDDSTYLYKLLARLYARQYKDI